MFYHEALRGKYVTRAVLFDLEPGVIGAVTLSRRSAKSSARKPREQHLCMPGHRLILRPMSKPGGALPARYTHF